MVEKEKAISIDIFLKHFKNLLYQNVNPFKHEDSLNKERLWHRRKTLAQVFPCEFCEIFKNIFFTKHLGATASDSTFMLILR